MIDALAIIGGASTATLAVLLVVVLRWGMRARDAEAGAVQSEAAEHVAHGETQLKLERSEYERDKAQQALGAMTKRAELLAKELSDAIDRLALGTGLAADDVDGRLRRLAAQATAADGALPAAVAVEPVSQPAAAGETIAAAVRNLDPIGDLR